MATTNREVNAKITLEGKSVGVKELRQELENFGAAGKQNAQTIVDGFDAVGQRAGKVEGAFAKGRLASERDVGAMVVHFQNLQQSIIGTFGSLEKAPALVQEAMKQTETRVTALRDRFVQTENQIKDTTASLNVAGASWAGLGNSMEMAAGSAGKFVAGFGLVNAALASGWSIGQRLNKLFGTDMTEWESFVGKFGAYFGGVIQAMSDGVFAFGHLMKAVLTGDIDEIKKSWEIYKETGVKALDALKGKTEEYKAAREDATAAEEKAAETASQSADAHDKLATQLERNVGAQEQLTDELATQIDTQDALTGSLAAANTEYDHAFNLVTGYKDAVHASNFMLGQAEAAHKKAAEEVKKLSATREAGDPILNHAIAQEQNLANVVNIYKNRLDESKTGLQEAQKEQTSATAAVDKLEQSLSNQNAKVSQLTQNYVELETSIRGAIKAMSDMKKQAEDTAGEE